MIELNPFIKHLLNKLLCIAYNKPLPVLTNHEKDLLSEFRASFFELPVITKTDLLPSEAVWINYLNRLRQLVLNQEPREFLRWSPVAETMFIVFARFIFTELKYLKSCPNWNTRWRAAIKESSIGNPVPYLFYKSSSGNLIHHAYHLAQFEEKTGSEVHDMKYVLEFGGGYGSMCRLFFNLGFSGKYIIFDFPAFNALQSYYLKSIGIQVHSLDTFREAKTGVLCISDLQELGVCIKEYFESSNSMFVATWSISEIPVYLRNAVLPLVANFDTFLLAYKNSFGEVNNIEYFDNWKNVNRDVVWQKWDIEHLSENYYLVGSRKNQSITEDSQS